jgi:uncharacterized protein (TIGR03437 family)
VTEGTQVRKVPPQGPPTIVAGTGVAGFSGDYGPATSAQLNGGSGCALDSAGNLYIGDKYNRRVRVVTPNGTIRTIAVFPSYETEGPSKVALDASGNVYTLEKAPGLVRKLSPNRPARMTAYSGDTQRGLTGSALPLPLGVQVTGQTGLPVAGMPITWTVSSGTAALSAASSLTDAKGQAQVTATLGTVAGPVQITAAAGTLPPVTFAAQADQSVSTDVTVIVRGTNDPWLAGMPEGSNASCDLQTHGTCDVAPAQSPASVILSLNPASTITIAATGGVNKSGSFPFGPDGNPASMVSHDAGPENGISNVTAPANSLVGVFLGPAGPNLLPPPDPDADPTHPGLRQVFLIGSNRTVAPPSGATRLFLGTMDTSRWSDQLGYFTVKLTVVCAVTAAPCSKVNQAPAVNSGGVVSAADSRLSLAPGSWATVYGADFTPLSVVYSNLTGLNSTGGYGVGLYQQGPDTYAVAYGFTVPAGTDYVFAGGAYHASFTSGVNSVNLTLDSDAGSSPGAEIESINLRNVVPGSRAIVSFSSAARPSLVSGRQYWLSAAMANPSTSKSVWWMPSQPDTGIGAISRNGGAWSVNKAASRGAFQVLGTPQAVATGVPLPSTLAGVTVTLGGQPVPLSYVGPSQINFQVPYETPTGTFDLVVAANGGASDSVPITVASVAPGILVYGDNWGVIQDQGYSIIGPSNPAKVGSYVTLYGIGAGAVSPAVATGDVAPNLPLSTPLAEVTASINGVPAAVAFAGLTPGSVGLLQVNLQIPELPSGTYPIQITVGGVSSNTPSITVAQ